MSRRLLFVLVLSLLANLGVIAAFAYRYVGGSELPLSAAHSRSLPAYLELDARQRQLWQQAEADFLPALQGDAREIARHRQSLIAAIFAERTDRAAIEAERRAIAALQERQQQRIIEQLLKEKELLNAGQRQALAQYLLRQDTHGTPEGRAHAR